VASGAIHAIDAKGEVLYVGQQMDVLVDAAGSAASVFQAETTELGERQP
jgi:hypothetical protein